MISTSITYLERTTLQLTHSAVAQIMSFPNDNHTRSYMIFSSQQRTAKDNASPGTAEEIDELLNALVLSQFS